MKSMNFHQFLYVWNHEINFLLILGFYWSPLTCICTQCHVHNADTAKIGGQMSLHWPASTNIFQCFAQVTSHSCKRHFTSIIYLHAIRGIRLHKISCMLWWHGCKYDLQDVHVNMMPKNDSASGAGNSMAKKWLLFTVKKLCEAMFVYPCLFTL